jgi:hypothetical protein
MNGTAVAIGNGNGVGSAASAADPRLPSLKKDNCIVPGRYRQIFSAQENIRLYIQRFGENNVGALTVTAAECLEAADFQRRWHSFINALRPIFPTGMWTRERQPRSGNWHAHAVVNVGWDIKTNFPRAQVLDGFYANVDRRLRELWKRLRKAAASRGLGRIELLPLRYDAEVCAKYFTKYLTKSLGSEKCVGEERCHLFGRWGGVRFVFPRFSFLSARIMQKRKQLLAQMLELGSETELAKMLGPHWWFHHGEVVREMIMPLDYYMVGPVGNRRLDEIGRRALSRDWPSWPDDLPGEDVIERSQFNVFHSIGCRLFGRNSKEASNFAWSFFERREYVPQILNRGDRPRLLKLASRDES